MKLTRKIICLMSSILMLMTVVVPAAAADSATEMTAYVVSGASYTLPAQTEGGEAITWDSETVNTTVPGRRIVTGNTASGAVKLTVNVGMYAPDILDNFNDETVGKEIKTPALAVGEWETYSVTRYANTFAQENTDNVYLKMVNTAYVRDEGTENETTIYSGAYGALYTFSGDGKTDTTGVSGLISISAKLKIPKEYMNKQIEITLIDNVNTAPQNTGDDNSMFVGRIYAAADGYYYNDYYSGGFFGNAVKLADYNEQWINLNYVVNTVTGAFKLYCNDKMCLELENGYYYSTSTTKEPGNNVRFLRIRNNEAEVWVDDIVLDANVTSTSEDVLYYSDITAPEYTLNVGEAGGDSMLYTTSLVKQDGTDSEKSLGLIIGALAPADTSMVGIFEVPISYYEGTVATYNIMDGLVYALNESFSDFTSSITGISKVVEGDNSVLSITSELSNDNADRLLISGKAEDAITDSVYEVGFKLRVPSYSDITTGSSKLQMQLFGTSTNYPIIDMVVQTSKSGYQLVVSNTAVLKYAHFTADGSTWHDIRIKIDESTGLAAVCLGETEISTFSLKYTDYDPYRWRVYRSGATALLKDLSFDDFYIAGYNKVVSVADTANAVTVVKGQPVPDTYVETTLTDGTTNKLPVICTTDTAGTTTGTVYGYTNTDGSAVTVNVPVTVIDLPYTAAISGGNLEVTRLTDYAPDAVIYGATYTDGKLDSVTVLGSITSETAWTEDVTSIALADGISRVFIFSSRIQPLSEVAE